MDNEYFKNSVDSNKLNNRLGYNKKTQKINFTNWLFSKYNLNNNLNQILDLGCGTGSQTDYFLRTLGNSCQVLSIDASEESISALPYHKNLDKFCVNFDDTEKLDQVLDGKKFDLINCTYAIYYSIDPIALIKRLTHNHLAESGKIYIAGPTWPHELYTLVTNQFGEDTKITKTINFMGTELQLYLKKEVSMFETHQLNNVSEFKDFSELASFVLNTTYGSKISKVDLVNFLGAQGQLQFKKTSLLSIFGN